MGVITSLTAQKRNPTRVNVFLDGSFAFGLSANAAMGIAIGQELTDADIERLERLDSTDKAKDAAVRLIALRPRSVAEIKRKLRQKEYDDEIIDRVIERLQAVDLLDDNAFAAYWVEQRDTFKPRSRMALSHELRQKGIDRETIEAALQDLDETAAAKRAAQKKAERLSALSSNEFRLKLGQYLQRQGFHYGIAKPVIDELWQELRPDTEE